MYDYIEVEVGRDNAGKVIYVEEQIFIPGTEKAKIAHAKRNALKEQAIYLNYLIVNKKDQDKLIPIFEFKKDADNSSTKITFEEKLFLKDSPEALKAINDYNYRKSNAVKLGMEIIEITYEEKKEKEREANLKL